MMTSVTTLLALVRSTCWRDVIRGFVFAMIWGVIAAPLVGVRGQQHPCLPRGQRDCPKPDANKGNQLRTDVGMPDCARLAHGPCTARLARGRHLRNRTCSYGFAGLRLCAGFMPCATLVISPLVAAPPSFSASALSSLLTAPCGLAEADKPAVLTLFPPSPSRRARGQARAPLADPILLRWRSRAAVLATLARAAGPACATPGAGRPRLAWRRGAHVPGLSGGNRPATAPQLVSSTRRVRTARGPDRANTSCRVTFPAIAFRPSLAVRRANARRWRVGLGARCSCPFAAGHASSAAACLTRRG